ncbi:MAG: four helix bundle protein [Patescibacteria group bacterium]|nr:four helix bundle protein [Patescibacteria group bacterium]
MHISRFEDMIAWQRSREFVKKTYISLHSCCDYGYKDQIQRAAISIMNNIAGGYDRKDKKEYLYFLKVAKASCSECRSMLYVAEDIGYLSELTFKINSINKR